MKTLIATFALALAFAGCSLAPSDKVIGALANDPASGCVTVMTPYGSAMVARTNTPGTTVKMSNGACTIEVPVAPAK